MNIYRPKHHRARELLISLGLCCLTGCGASLDLRDLEVRPNVHLITTTLSEREVQSISRRFERSGFQVSLSEVPAPLELESHSIIHSPILDAEVLTAVSEILRRGGYWEVEVIMGSFGSHSYRGNNLGLYLLPDD